MQFLLNTVEENRTDAVSVEHCKKIGLMRFLLNTVKKNRTDAVSVEHCEKKSD